MRGLSAVAASRGHSSSRCAGLSLSRPLLLRSTGSRCEGSVVVAYGPSCSAARGIFPDQGSNPCPLHWQADSQPLRHQGSPVVTFLFLSSFVLFPCDLMTIFSVMFRFLSLSFVYIYYRISVCAYHEVFMYKSIIILICCFLNFKRILKTLHFTPLPTTYCY